MKIARIPAVLLLVWAIAFAADSGGALRGSAVDSDGGPIPNARVRLLRPDTRVTAYRSVSREDGSFRLADVKAGRYMIAIGSRGFRERLIGKVEIQESRETNIGSVRLEIVGCDAPGVFCDTFSTEPALPPDLSSGDLKLFPACSVDLEGGRVACTVELDAPPATSPLGERDADFGVEISDGRKIYFVPRNRAQLAEPDTGGNCRKALSSHRVRVDGVGAGGEMWVQTRRGHVSHVYFTTDVQSKGAITLHYFTYQ